MPTPVAHSLAAVAIFLAGPRSARGVANWHWLVILVGVAALPDLDFIPGYMLGDPRRFHWGPTHSFTAAVLVGAAVALVVRRRGARFVPAFVVATSAYASHVVLDMLLGLGPAEGLQAFWPFSTERHALPWQVFRMFPAAIAHVGPVRALLSPAALPLVARELAVMVPVCLTFWVIRRAVDRS